jgi:hypothetical protein
MQQMMNSTEFYYQFKAPQLELEFLALILQTVVQRR